MRILALLFAIGCSSDIAIITTEKKPQDTNAPIVDEASDTDSSQPDTEGTTSEMTELTIGFAQLSLTQIACPACMGVSNEFDILDPLVRIGARLEQITLTLHLLDNRSLMIVGTCPHCLVSSDNWKLQTAPLGGGGV